MNKAYNNVEITPEELASLEDTGETTESEAPVEESTEAQPTETEESVETVNEAVSEPEGFEIDGERYDADTIKEWMKDSQNKTEWSKSNTQKAQDLAKWNKLVEKVNGDDEFKEHLKDFFFDNPEELDKLGLNGTLPDLETEVVETAEENPLEQRLEALEEIESERLLESRVNDLDAQLTKLEDANPTLLNEEGTKDFLDFTEANAERFTVNGIPNMELAFKEWSYDAKMDELAHYKKLAENKTRNDGKIVGNSEAGAREAKAPKKYSSFKELSAKDPEIAKYFE